MIIMRIYFSISWYMWTRVCGRPDESRGKGYGSRVEVRRGTTRDDRRGGRGSASRAKQEKHENEKENELTK